MSSVSNSGGEGRFARIREFLTVNRRAVVGRAYPRVVGGTREISWMFWEVVMPLFTVGGFVFYYKYLNEGRIDGDEWFHFYTGLVVLSGAMMAFWMNVMWGMAAQLYWERESGNLQLYMIAPCSRISILLGMALGGMFMTTLRATVSLLIGWAVFSADFSKLWENPVTTVSIFAVFVVTMSALYGMGMLLSSLFLIWGRQAWAINELIMEPVQLVSGFWFPAKTLGAVVAGVAAILPMTLGLDAMRQLLFSSPQADPWLMPYYYELLFLAVTGVLFFIAAVYALRYTEEVGKREGRLIMRWQ